MMKRRKQLVISIWVIAFMWVLLVTTQGCQKFAVGNAFLNKPPGEDVTIDTVFSNPKYAKQILTYAYETLPSGNGDNKIPYDGDLVGDNDPLASLTDIDESYNNNNGGAATLYYNGSLTATKANQHPNRMIFDFTGSGAWTGIRYAYLFLENVNKVPGMNEKTKKRLKAEARMIIALHYSDLFRNYGGMMWVGHAYKPNENFHNPRMTAKATLDSTIALINKAIPNLPFVLKDPGTEQGRFTKAGAMGLKCRDYLFAASPLFNSDKPYLEGKASDKKLTWFGGYDPNLWKKAVKACGDLITKNQQEGMPYQLSEPANHSLKDERKAFRHGYYDRNSPEILISIQKLYQGSRGANGMPFSKVSEGVGNTTDNYVKMFPMADGTPIDQAGSGYDPTHPYTNRDQRLYETVLVNGVPYLGQSDGAELWIGGRQHQSKRFRKTRTGYREFKFALQLNQSRFHPLQWPYLRLPEIYLSYAEALNEVNGGPTSEAYKYVNKIRNRVGLKDLPTGLSKEEFRKKVIRERALELGYEKTRWYDMVRWKIKDVFTKPLYGMYICKKSTPAAAEGECKDLGYGHHESDKFIYTRFKIRSRYWQKNFSPKWYLSPFPHDEVNKGYGLIQNPGW
jgi:hypothetical protein